MFFEPTRIQHVRQMILANNAEQRQAALTFLEPAQCADFQKLFAVMDGFPVTIRLLDSPLHEFLPTLEDDLRPLADMMGVNEVDVRARVLRLQEVNPMLGHRGCRLAITAPEIYQMQVRAIFGAQQALNVAAPQVEIMFPLIMDVVELDVLVNMVTREAEAYQKATGFAPRYILGSMIEVPRAALLADRLAENAAFFSFGTNDLTQTSLGLSRDDAGGFLTAYRDKKILSDDPFATLDIDGVGALIEMATDKARRARPDVKLGLCGEHGGDPRSLDFCHHIGLDYVSCSPFRVPIARLALAQAALKATTSE